MVQCSTGTSSHQPYDLLTNHRGHDLDLDLKKAWDAQCSPDGGSDTSLANG